MSAVSFCGEAGSRLDVGGGLRASVPASVEGPRPPLPPQPAASWRREPRALWEQLPALGWVWSRALDLSWLRVLARSRAEVGLSGGLGSCTFLFSKSPSGSSRGIFVGISGPAALASQGRVRHADSQTGQLEALGCPPPTIPGGPRAKGVRCPGRGRCCLPWGQGQSQGSTRKRR